MTSASVNLRLHELNHKERLHKTRNQVKNGFIHVFLAQEEDYKTIFATDGVTYDTCLFFSHFLRIQKPFVNNLT